MVNISIVISVLTLGLIITAYYLTNQKQRKLNILHIGKTGGDL